MALPEAEELRVDLGSVAVTLARWTRPEWACAAGRDRYGLWATLKVGEVKHRLRWIPPGRFTMGSPGGEAGRDDDEGPQHEVTLTRGFWLGETPVTQALWVAVMGENPSSFQDPERPVEQVSWDDTQRFFERLRDEHGFGAELPTEAQWEYACRAGTQTATWVGDLTLKGTYDAPELATIAWYEGNSGQGFDQGKGMPFSRVPGVVGGTRKVAQKQPNPFGLYDILGNVWEWCQAYWQPTYLSEVTEDPPGPSSREMRVGRGGSWDSPARNLRSASRDPIHPSVRYAALGFRLVRSHAALEHDAAPSSEQVIARTPWSDKLGTRSSGQGRWQFPRSDPNHTPEQLSYFEAEARDAVVRAVADLRLERSRGAAIVSLDHDEIFEATSYDELFDRLCQLFDDTWVNHAPFDGGEPVFEPENGDSHVEDILAGLSSEFRQLGWDV
ncbi:MAG: formylglycine-generating enzyme family protein [Myxococcales bacterium]|nr:formylglycine-generating enzyme family protein [Myxococcales bacterium]